MTIDVAGTSPDGPVLRVSGSSLDFAGYLAAIRDEEDLELSSVPTTQGRPLQVPSQEPWGSACSALCGRLPDRGQRHQPCCTASLATCVMTVAAGQAAEACMMRPVPPATRLSH